MKHCTVITITAVIGFLASTAQADTTLYAWETDSEKLHSLDTAGPTTTPIGPGNNIYTIIAEIEFGDGVVYGSDTEDNTQLHSIDPNTGLIFDTLTMSFPPEGNVITSMEFVGGVLYAGLTTEGGGPTYLSTVDRGSGVVSVVGPTGFGSPFGGLAYDGSKMYGISAGGSGGELFTVDLGTGAATSVGLVTVAGRTIGTTALEFGDDGILYALPNVSDALNGHLLSIDPATAAGTDLGDTGYASLVALTDPSQATGGGEELIGDFDGYGIWIWYDDGAPVKLHPLDVDSVVTGNLDGIGDGELIVDFGLLGVYVYYNNTAWGSQLHPISPSAMATGDLDGNGQDELIVDLGMYGVWVYYNNTSWGPRLHAQSPELIAAADMDGNGRDEVIFDFGAAGVWVYYNDTAWGTRLHALSPAQFVVGDLNGNGQDEVIFDFPGYGVWVYYDNSFWGPRLRASSPTAMTVGEFDNNGLDDVAFDYGSYGVWIYYNNSTWSARLHAFTTEGMVAADLDGNGRDELIIDFGDGIGLWGRYNDNSSDWRRLTTANPETMVTGQLGSNE